MSMLAMTSVIVEKCVFICFLTIYILQAGPPNIVGPEVTPPTFPLDVSGCIDNALINALIKLMQCVNVFKKLTLDSSRTN